MQDIERQPEQRNAANGWRIYALPAGAGSAGAARDPALESADDWLAVCRQAAESGFDTLSIPLEHYDAAEPAPLRACREACSRAGLRLMADIGLTELPASGADALLAAAQAKAAELGQGAAVLLRGLGMLPLERWKDFLDGLRIQGTDRRLIIWTPGMTPAQVAALEPLGVDGVCSSLPWWNFRDAWLIEEYERLRAVAPIIAPLADPRALPLPRPLPEDVMRRLAVACVVGDGVLAPAGCFPVEAASTMLEELARQGADEGGRNGPRRLTGPMSVITALFRGDGQGRLLLLNPDTQRSGGVARGLLERRLPDGYVLAAPPDEEFALDAGGWTFVEVDRADHIAEQGTPSGQMRRSLSNALRSPRIAIEAVRPSVDGGEFPVKRILGETVVIQADIFMDGHEELAAELLWRPVNEADWHRAPMVALGNDAWEARINPRQLGRYVYVVTAWADRWHGYRVQLGKKAAAGVDVSLEVEEGRRMLVACLERADEGHAAEVAMIEDALAVIGMPSDGSLPPRRRTRSAAVGRRPAPASSRGAVAIPPATSEQIERLLDPELATAVGRLEEREFEARTPVQYPLAMERQEAVFSSWYELFPRSQSPVEGAHGTLRDVIERLPLIRRMGFDVLYFPPIHPIGRANRKGRNNSLQAGPDDPGSPYAIGSADGGHDALHPELGTLEDFQALLAAARSHGLEIALDFAIQCSPDHPWLREHPDWFNWRVDGSLRYAENPPKRYEDIVNPDFYSPLASSPRQAALWRALRDIIFFWVRQGVRIFRVDNPHTKPLPFWQWMLGEVRERHPDTIFLSEAFTRPAMMYRLAKIGFSQSYTYFTWRNTRQELTDYLTELNRSPVREFFRPNFFVNTPDINPYFLQTSGRPGFLIRAALACTLSGSWGMYNGFELCVAEAVPGKEEYLDSEKYQLRRWDMNAPGNIIEEITRLNRIRRSHPALQSHLGVRFHDAGNDRILFYSRYSPEGDSVVLVAVSMDPQHRQAGTLDLPLWEWGLPDDGLVPLHDLFDDRRFSLRGRRHHVELTPERPFVLWALARE